MPRPTSPTGSRIRSALIASSIAAALSVLSTTCSAQAPAVQGPPPVNIVQLLNLDAARAAKVTAIFTATHEQMAAIHSALGLATNDAERNAAHAQMRALHEYTKTQLEAVLTKEEMATLHEAMPRPPRGPQGAH